MLEVNARYPLTGMSCVSCAGSIATMLNQLNGIQEAHVNFSDHSLLIKFNPELIDPEGIQHEIQQLGFGMLLPVKDGDSFQEELNFRAKQLKKARILAISALVLSLPTAVLGMFFMHWAPGYWVSACLSIIVLGFQGRHFFSNAFQQLKHKNPGMDLLVALSSGTSWIYSFITLLNGEAMPHLYFESASMVVAFVLTGKWLEEKARMGTSESIRGLMQLQQSEAEVILSDGSLKKTHAAELKPGMRIRVKSGEKIPADGWLEDNEALVDERFLTGEPIIVSKLKGQPLWAGTINGKIAFQMISAATGESTRLSLLIRRVREAQNSKAPVQKLADKIAGWFVPAVVLLAILTLLIWGIWGGITGWETGLNAFLSILVVACPCALGLATPTALMAGLGAAAERGVLIRNGEVLEKAARLNFLFLDKTGTLTTGQSSVTSEQWWPTEQLSKEELSSLFLGLMNRSNHPLAESLSKHWQGLGKSEIRPEHAESIPGAGTWGRWNNLVFLAGSKNLMVSQEAVFPNTKITENADQEVWFCIEKQIVGLCKLQDNLKPDASQLIEALKRKNIEVALLSGDKASTSLQIAEAIGLPQSAVFAESSPSAKGEVIRSEKRKHPNAVVGMAGDGINDAEALSLADVSFALGQGADIAKECADIVLTGNRLMLISEALGLSAAVMRRIRQNLGWAFGYNLLAIPIAAGLLLPWSITFNPMWAGAAMALSSLSVVLNALRPYRVSEGTNK